MSNKLRASESHAPTTLGRNEARDSAAPEPPLQDRLINTTPRSYRDRKDIALQSAAVSKVQNPNSVVKLKDLQTGEEIVVAFTQGQQ
jgi:hypothetical protein